MWNSTTKLSSSYESSYIKFEGDRISTGYITGRSDGVSDGGSGNGTCGKYGNESDRGSGGCKSILNGNGATSLPNWK